MRPKGLSFDRPWHDSWITPFDWPRASLRQGFPPTSRVAPTTAPRSSTSSSQSPTQFQQIHSLSPIHPTAALKANIIYRLVRIPSFIFMLPGSARPRLCEPVSSNNGRVCGRETSHRQRVECRKISRRDHRSEKLEVRKATNVGTR